MQPYPSGCRLDHLPEAAASARGLFFVCRELVSGCAHRGTILFEQRSEAQYSQPEHDVRLSHISFFSLIQLPFI
jgi:hypothetical protein